MTRRAPAAVVGAVIAVAALAIALPRSPAAAAEEASEREVVDLAGRAAAGDAEATSRLRAVDRVGDRPADLRRALDDDARPRAAALAQWDAGDAPGPPSPGTEQARRDARQVLDQPEYHGSRVPRPLRGLLRRIGEMLDPVLGPVVRAAERVWEDSTTRLLAALAAVVAVAAVTAALARRRARAVTALRRGGRRVGRLETPEELERAADGAERAGDAALAYRLRFRAGVLRLAAEGAVTYRPAATTGDLRRQLRSPAFDALAWRFDEVAYGGDAATAGDLDSIRTAWPRVRQEAGAP